MRAIGKLAFFMNRTREESQAKQVDAISPDVMQIGSPTKDAEAAATKRGALHLKVPEQDDNHSCS